MCKTQSEFNHNSTAVAGACSFLLNTLQFDCVAYFSAFSWTLQMHLPLHVWSFLIQRVCTSDPSLLKRSPKDPQKILKRSSGDPSSGNPSTFFTCSHSGFGIGAKKGGERQFWLVDRKRLALSKYSIALSQMWESFPCCGICAGFP